LNPKNRTLRAEVELPNLDEILRPGMYAYASLFVDHPVWALPSSAIESKDDGCFCYIVKNGTAGPTPLRIGARHGELVDVLKKRISGGDQQGENSWVDLSGDEQIVKNYTAVFGNGMLTGTH
jgi:multidrug efflux pump subunit AcrA (membrane-fusion protein)